MLNSNAASAADASSGGREAYVTLYIGSLRAPSFDGLRVLVRSIRQHDTLRPLLVMVAGAHAASTAAGIECELGRVNVRTINVPMLNSTNAACLATMQGGQGTRMLSAFTMYNAFDLTDYERLVWVEGDQIVLRSLEPLWRRQLSSGAVGAAVFTMEYMPKCNEAASEAGGLQYIAKMRRALKFNTGVLLMRPNATTFQQLLSALRGRQSYKCSDGFQTLWNQQLARRVECLSRSFNCFDPAYMHAPTRDPSLPAEPPAWIAANRSSDKLSCLRNNESAPHVIHFAGSNVKPWNIPSRNPYYVHSWGLRMWREHLRAYRFESGIGRKALACAHLSGLDEQSAGGDEQSSSVVSSSSSVSSSVNVGNTETPKAQVAESTGIPGTGIVVDGHRFPASGLGHVDVGQVYQLPFDIRLYDPDPSHRLHYQAPSTGYNIRPAPWRFRRPTKLTS